MILEGGMSGQRSLFLTVVFVMFVGIMFSGCSKKTVSGPGTGDSSAMGPTESLETQVVAGDNIMEGRTSGPMLPVYFDFDASMVRDDQVERIETNADFIKKTLRSLPLAQVDTEMGEHAGLAVELGYCWGSAPMRRPLDADNHEAIRDVRDGRESDPDRFQQPTRVHCASRRDSTRYITCRGWIY